MANSKLTNAEKKEVIKMFSEYGEQQQNIARHFNVSQRTIYRVLHEAGLVGLKTDSLSDEDRKILNVVRSHGLTAEQADHALRQPAMTPSNIRNQLARLSQADLGEFFTSVLLTKIQRGLTERAEAAAQNDSEAKKEDAA